jgi:hypothetical protein
MDRSIAENPATGNAAAGGLPRAGSAQFCYTPQAGQVSMSGDVFSGGLWMAEMQTFRNHAKFVPVFHFGILPILALNLGWSVYRALHAFSWNTAIGSLVAFALVLLALYARMFALAVQDRVIRLEMQLRLRQLLPSDLRERVGEFTLGQLISLRFAGDAELPALARKVLDEKLTDRKAIKQLIEDWQPDFLRA